MPGTVTVVLTQATILIKFQCTTDVPILCTLSYNPIVYAVEHFTEQTAYVCWSWVDFQENLFGSIP